MAHATDLNLSPKDLQGLTSADALAAFFTSLGYDTGARKPLSPEAIGLAGESAAPLKGIEVLSEDADGFLRVVFVHLRSLTAKSRNDLARVLGRTNVDHLLVLTSDFDVLEFVLLAKRRRHARGPADVQRIQVVPLSLAVARKAVDNKQLRAVRRFTWTSRDGLEQFDKLRSVFEAAAFSEDYFCNRALFADHYLITRLREDPAWRENPSEAFQRVKSLLRDARSRWLGKGEAIVRQELYEPIFEMLGFQAAVNKEPGDAQTSPDYLLQCSPRTPGGEAPGKTAAFVYAWDRWLDGPDFNLDQQTPDENPGACVVSALDEGLAEWIVMTNGRQWRLYSRHAHSRATNFYEVDLAEALVASGDTDPNEAFRYWWLFFRAAAFEACGAGVPPAKISPSPLRGEGRGEGSLKSAPCWLDLIAEGSRDYAKELGERLKERIFVTIFPHLAQGFLHDRKQRLGMKNPPDETERDEIFEATLTLLYRLLFLLYAESRDLLPIREAPYRAASLTTIKEEIAERAGIAESESADRLAKTYSVSETSLYDRLQRLCAAMDGGDASLNVPIYNGGLFKGGGPEKGGGHGEEASREQRIAQFLADHKVPDRHLALAIDRLARDPDEKTFSLVFIDYKSLEVRHLGSIYEGLLEFKLKIALEDLATQKDKKAEKYIPLSALKPKRGKAAEAVVRKGEVYLSNDKAERKASGSYYTPDPIVEYIVEQTVGPVLAENLEKLRPDFRKVRQTFERQLANIKDPRIKSPFDKDRDVRSEAADKTYDAHRDLVDSLFDFRTLDPAMGSGHFLVEAVDFITDRLLTFLNAFPVNPVSFMLDRTRRNILEALGEQGVSVDPEKLVEVNLLKRHVLKRCIYGVDLNPMAVELAKVSLWLDAFTIGAPLSFLDHHLRCGNSLIGATFKDLEATVKPTKNRAASMFRIDYDALVRAIRNVVQVNKMSDATAAEARQSASAYDHARQELGGYQIVLDLLAARHFGYPKAPGLLEHGDDLKLTSRQAFLASLDDLEELSLVGKVTDLARQPNLRFFHWEVEFPEVFFAFSDPDQRHLKHKNELAEGSAGFDAVVGNPPYDVLAGKELDADLTTILDYFRKEPSFQHALGGKLNLYKLFVCANVTRARRGGTVGHIVPMALLGDEQAVGVRKMLLRDTCILAIEAFPQKDDPQDRVFEDAKLSTCVFVTERSNEQCEFRSRVHPGKDILPSSPSLIMRRPSVVLYDPENQPIVACSQEDWDLAARIMASGRMARLGEFCTAFQGEVNETTDGAKGNISDDPKDGPQILRGSNICLYLLRAASQGEEMFLRKVQYLKDKKPVAKAWHHQTRRVGLQESCPQNNFRRVIACLIPQGEFCNHVINYFPEPDCRVPLEVLLALLNCKLIDWYFRLGSTNAHVSHYQLYNLPAPRFADDGTDARCVGAFNELIARERFDDAFGSIIDCLVEPPFSRSVVCCLTALVERIIQIEQARGEIARAERSALSSAAQPYQNLIDRILYRMAGLTDEEAEALERRLDRML